MTPPWDAAAQPGVETWVFTIPFWPRFFLARGKWMLIAPALDWQDPLVLLTHALDMTLGYVPTAHSESSICPSLPNDNGGPRATLQRGDPQKSLL